METGVYKYSVLSWDDGRLERKFTPHKMRVEILEEKGGRYMVRYMQHHARTQEIGGRHWVNKKNVTLDRPEVKPPHVNVRLPYKDND